MSVTAAAYITYKNPSHLDPPCPRFCWMNLLSVLDERKNRALMEANLKCNAMPEGSMMLQLVFSIDTENF